VTRNALAKDKTGELLPQIEVMIDLSLHRLLWSMANEQSRFDNSPRQGDHRFSTKVQTPAPFGWNNHFSGEPPGASAVGD
jgi:hypothetical protein